MIRKTSRAHRAGRSLSIAALEVLETRRLFAAPKPILPMGEDWTTPDGHFHFETAPHKVVVGFDQNVETESGALTVHNLTTGEDVEGFVESGASSSRAWTATGEGYYAAEGTLWRGNYDAILNADLVTNSAGEKLDGNRNGTGGDDYVSGFFFLPGDFNHDRYVNGDDLHFWNANQSSQFPGFHIAANGEFGSLQRWEDVKYGGSPSEAPQIVGIFANGSPYTIYQSRTEIPALNYQMPNYAQFDPDKPES